jgi:Response regulators consisting of a CheY-like receiver domain and a winged-helix DNA-binding domain
MAILLLALAENHINIRSVMIKRIHILEDDEDIRYIIGVLLKDEGYELQLSSTFTELKSKLKDSVPDLFILDVMIPDGDGTDICGDLKSDPFTKHIPIIVMSANDQNKQKSLDAGANDYISKPFDIDYIVKRINSQLA